MSKEGPIMPELRPFYEDVKAHYDLSDDFFALWLDPTRTYTCAYFPEPGMTLEEAQLAKLDLTLAKLDLKPGMTLLDIGCGWGSALLRAYENYDVNVIGITLSRNQYEHVGQKLAELKGPRTAEVRLQGWEEFEGSVDRIVAIGALEHFRYERHDAFWETAWRILPEDGVCLMHTIIGHTREDMQKRGTPWTPSMLRFTHLIAKYIFPGAQLASPSMVLSGSARVGFRCDNVQILGWHYARTLDIWLENLVANKDEAIRLTSEDIYNKYTKYLESCAYYFRIGSIDLAQFTLTKRQPEWLQPSAGAMKNFVASAR